jgi:hypothetical protein
MKGFKCDGCGNFIKGSRADHFSANATVSLDKDQPSFRVNIRVTYAETRDLCGPCLEELALKAMKESLG